MDVAAYTERVSAPSRLVQLLLEKVFGQLEAPHRAPALPADPAAASEVVAALAPVAAAQPLSVAWATMNGSRLDATVVSGEHEWWVVLAVDDDGRVREAGTVERPLYFPGVPGGRAIIVNGPSSVGKTTVMEAVVEVATTPWVLFDELRLGDIKSEYLIWRDRSPTLTPGFLAGMTAFAAAGNQMILSAGQRDVTLFDELRSTVPTLCVRLVCPLAVRVARQATRDDRWGGLTEESETEPDGWTYDLRFDTSTMDAVAIAKEILAAVA